MSEFVQLLNLINHMKICYSRIDYIKSVSPKVKIMQNSQWNEERKLGKNLYDCCMIDFDREKSSNSSMKSKKIMTDIGYYYILPSVFILPCKVYQQLHSKVIYDAHRC